MEVSVYSGLLPAVLAATALLLCLLLAMHLLQRLLRHIWPVDCGPLRPTGDGTVQQLQPWQEMCSASWQQAGVVCVPQPCNPLRSMPHLCPHFSSRCCVHDLAPLRSSYKQSLHMPAQLQLSSAQLSAAHLNILDAPGPHREPRAVSQLHPLRCEDVGTWAQLAEACLCRLRHQPGQLSAHEALL